MKRFIFLIMTLIGCFCLTTTVLGQEDIQKFPSCNHCGMDRGKFAHSRMLIEYDDGTIEGMCSLRCAAVDLAIKIDKAPKAIWVGAYDTKKLIDAERASWLIGGSKMGVMTKRAKWGFEGPEQAERFKKESGGELSTLELAIKAAYEDLYEDTKMIREKRKMMKKEPRHHQ